MSGRNKCVLLGGMAVEVHRIAASIEALGYASVARSIVVDVHSRLLEPGKVTDGEVMARIVDASIRMKRIISAVPELDEVHGRWLDQLLD